MHLNRLAPFWKDLSGISSLREGELCLLRDEHREVLLSIKRGEQPWSEATAWRLSLHNAALRNHFDDVFAWTRLPERSDYAWANEALVKARREMARKDDYRRT